MKTIMLPALVLALVLATTDVAAQEHPHGAQSDSSAAEAGQGCVGMGGAMMGQGMMMREGMGMDRMGDGMMDMMKEMGSFMMRAMRSMPNNILRNADELELAPEQVERIQQLAAELSAGRKQVMPDLRAAHQELRQAFEAETVDAATVQAAAERFLGLHARLHAQHIAVAAAGRAVLTGEQLERLDSMGMDCGTMRGTMRGAPTPGQEL